MGRWLLAGVIMAVALYGAAGAQQRHTGYYYPAPVTQEIYVSRAEPMSVASRTSRIGFVVGLTQRQSSEPYPPTYVIFAKGDDAKKLIIVSIGANGFKTIYQARALLAQLTAISRATNLFRDLQVEDQFTFFDLVRMLGFKQLTISDGATFSHQVIFK